MDKEIVYDASSEAELEERNNIEITRDNSGSVKVGVDFIGKINSYKFTILIREKESLKGEFTREEMDLVYRLYSSEGSNLTQRSVSRYFPNYTFQDFKRILRAFNITKASSPFAPHVFEEKTTEELIQLTLQSKENNYLKKLEQDRTRLVEDKFKKLTKEHFELKQSISDLGDVINKDRNYTIYEKKNPVEVVGRDLILHLADFHIGAKVRKTSVYKNEYNYEVIKSRLSNLLERISNKNFHTIIVNLLGDMLDGMDMKTARQDHLLPQNMDNFEQVEAYLEIMEWFFVSLYKLNICNNIKIYSVKNGNHDGIAAYVATQALFSKLALILPNCETKLFSEFFGYYKHGEHQFVLCHGKDDEFMKRGLPLNITDKEKIMIYNWLESQNIHGNNIHFIKGDLHSDNLNSTYKLDYRNCLSLFGASDYASFNFERNHYGVSFELIDNFGLTRGTFNEL